MPSTTVFRKTPAQHAELWTLMADFKAMDVFNPTLKESHLLDGSCEIGPGAERQCTMKNGHDYIHERVIDWQEGRSYRIEVFGGTMPMDAIEAELEVRSLGAGGSELRMTMSYQPRWGWVGHLVEPILLRPMVRFTMARVLKGLAAAGEADQVRVLAG